MYILPSLFHGSVKSNHVIYQSIRNISAEFVSNYFSWPGVFFQLITFILKWLFCQPKENQMFRMAHAEVKPTVHRWLQFLSSASN